MPHIYKITNLVNNKVYIGKTGYDSINDRWCEHLTDFYKPTEEKRPLYAAMQKYGVQNFVITLVETVETDTEACEREKFWIEHYRSYVGFSNCNGYNATLGGDGKNYISDQERQEICQYYLTVGQVKLTAQHFSHSEDTISKILKENNIKVNYIQKNEIEMRDLKTKELIKTFVNSVFVYDDKVVLTFNYSGDDRTITLNEIDGGLQQGVRLPSSLFHQKKSKVYRKVYFAFLLPDGS